MLYHWSHARWLGKQLSSSACLSNFVLGSRQASLVGEATEEGCSPSSFVPAPRAGEGKATVLSAAHRPGPCLTPWASAPSVSSKPWLSPHWHRLLPPSLCLGWPAARDALPRVLPGSFPILWNWPPPGRGPAWPSWLKCLILRTPDRVPSQGVGFGLFASCFFL